MLVHTDALPATSVTFAKIVVVEFAVRDVVVTTLLPDVPVTAVAIEDVHPLSLNKPRDVVEPASERERVTAGVWLVPGVVGLIDV